MRKLIIKPYRKLQGGTIVMVLIVLVVLLASSTVVFRSVETTTLVSNNIVNKTTSKSLGDIGVIAAINALNNIVDLETQTQQYYPVQQPVDANGLPTTVDWNNIPSQTIQNHTVQFVFERLCTGALPISNPEVQCTSINTAVGGSKKSTSAVITKTVYYYRGTIRVSGAKGSNSYIQAILVR